MKLLGHCLLCNLRAGWDDYVLPCLAEVWGMNERDELYSALETADLQRVYYYCGRIGMVHLKSISQGLRGDFITIFPGFCESTWIWGLGRGELEMGKMVATAQGHMYPQTCKHM